MRSGHLIRQAQAQEARDDKPCPRCSHRLGAHRGMPGVCGEAEGCECVISFADLDAWRLEGRA